jgi:hypothetical protein
VTSHHAAEARDEDVSALLHRLNNQLGVILAHAELIEAKTPDDRDRARASQVVGAALQAMSLAREIRTAVGTRD